jgi:hypothetical protein
VTGEPARPERCRRRACSALEPGDQPFLLYWLVLPVTCVVMVLGGGEPACAPAIGRAFIAIRDRDISAEVHRHTLAVRYKLTSFAISSFYAGLAGGLWAYLFRVVTPESFPAGQLHLLPRRRSSSAGHGHHPRRHPRRRLHDAGPGAVLKLVAPLPDAVVYPDALAAISRRSAPSSSAGSSSASSSSSRMRPRRDLAQRLRRYFASLAVQDLRTLLKTAAAKSGAKPLGRMT